MFFFFIIVLVVLFYLYDLQVKNGELYSALELGQNNYLDEKKPPRGNIYIKDGDDKPLRPLAIDIKTSNVYAVPKAIENPRIILGAISSIIYIDPEKKDSILARLSNRDSSYALIVSKLTKEEANKIKESELQGIYIGEDNTRFYPEGDLASHVLGYFGETREGGKRGYYGLEHYFEDILAGKTGAARGNSFSWNRRRTRFLFRAPI